MAEKEVKGRKKHIVTDTMGNLLKVKVHAANIHDTVGGGEVFKRAVEKYPTIKGCCADEGYRKTFENIVLPLGKTIKIYEITTISAQNMFVISHIYTLLRRF